MKQPVQLISEKELRRDFPIEGRVPGWFFSQREVSAGCYVVAGRDIYGREVSRQSTNPDAALAECIRYAQDVPTAKERTDDCTYMCEAVYPPPEDPKREAEFALLAAAQGGRLDFREREGSGAITLTFEFPTYEQAHVASIALRQAGAHIDSLGAYG